MTKKRTDFLPVLRSRNCPLIDAEPNAKATLEYLMSIQTHFLKVHCLILRHEFARITQGGKRQQFSLEDSL